MRDIELIIIIATLLAATIMARDIYRSRKKHKYWQAKLEESRKELEAMRPRVKQNEREIKS